MTTHPPFDPTLYLVTDRTNHTIPSFLHTIEQACENGVTLVQLREKSLSSREFYELAKQVKMITHAHKVPLIIDDRIDVALAVDADGVHVGASDLPVAIARKLMGNHKIVGATAKTVESAQKAYADGADYLGTGAIYPTTTKVVTVLTEVSTLNDICQAVPIPVVAIGGLNSENLSILQHSPIAGVAVVSAIMHSSAPAQSAARLACDINNMISAR